MKAQDLLDIISKMNPEDDICFLLFQRSQFGSTNEPVSKEAWASACHEFARHDTAGDDIGQWLMSEIKRNTKEK